MERWSDGTVSGSVANRPSLSNLEPCGFAATQQADPVFANNFGLERC